LATAAMLSWLRSRSSSERASSTKR
jgi:hypothetical protein